MPTEMHNGTYEKHLDGRVVETGGSEVFCFTTLVQVDGQRVGDVGLFMTNEGEHPYRVIRVTGLGPVEETD